MEKFQGLTPGSIIGNGTYRVEKVLGRGGFGISYLATDIKLARSVAIKEFFPKNYCNRDNTTSKVTISTQESKELIDKLKDRFLKEARHIARFDHPGIVRIHTIFEENDTAYYVMDYIEGSTLADIVKRNGPLSEEEALKYIEKVGKALDYIHARKMSHFDVKPTNILVRETDDQPILIDFGLSKQYDLNGEATTTGIMGVSHGYAPPEQYNASSLKDFTPQTDLYSLAATLYYILSGLTPPSAMTLLEEELTFPQDIPAELIPPISKAMMVRRLSRHKSVKAFLADLKEAVRKKATEDDDSSTVFMQPAGNGVGGSGKNKLDNPERNSAPQPKKDVAVVSENNKTPGSDVDKPVVPKKREAGSSSGVDKPVVPKKREADGSGGNNTGGTGGNNIDDSGNTTNPWMKWVWMGLGCVIILIAIFAYNKCNRGPVSALAGLEGMDTILVDTINPDTPAIGESTTSNYGAEDSDTETSGTDDSATVEPTDGQHSEPEPKEPEITEVEDLYWSSPLGWAHYTGKVALDPSSKKLIPNGKGRAKIDKGEFRDCVYEGDFIKGKMEGQATYVTKEGDVFKGTFKNNKYYKGRYTVKSTGDYFEGEFNIEGDPDLNNGAWYDKAGNKI